MVMSFRDHDEATGGDLDGGAKGFLEMFGDCRHYSSGDLFELVWRAGGGGGGSSSSSVDQVRHPSLTLTSPPPDKPPPSEDEMAAWLYPIVRGEDTGGGGGGGGAAALTPSLDDQQASPPEKLQTTEGRCSEVTSDSSERIRKPDGGARRSHHAETHSLTEKRRRSKINERFKTLQQLVPGCDKCNQASTLDQTIQYMKSLQQQIQAMSFGCGMKPASTAVYPVLQPPPLPPPPPPGMLAGGHVRPPGPVVFGPPLAMAPLVPMLPLVHRHPPVMVYSAPMLHYAAAAAAVNNVMPFPAGKSKTASCSGKSIM